MCSLIRPPLPTKVEGAGLSQVIGGAYFRRGVARSINLRSWRRKSKRSRRLKPQLEIRAPIRPALGRPVPAVLKDLLSPFADGSGKWRRVATRRVWWVEAEDHFDASIKSAHVDKIGA